MAVSLTQRLGGDGMRKFLVVLLVLSVIGGAFAQDSEGSWGSLSGEVGLNTSIRFVGDTEPVDGYPNSLMDGLVDGGWLKIAYENTIGPWSINLPLVAESGYFGTDSDDDGTLAKVTYSGVENLTVELPFSFQFSDGTNEGVGLLPVSNEFKASINATYDAGLFGFKFGVNDLLDSPSVGNVGGFYHFMNGQSQLYVSRGAYGTEWWRASSIVLTTGDSLTACDWLTLAPFTGPRGPRALDFHWENIESNGIAYRFFVLPDVLSVGLAFASGDEDPTFFDTGTRNYFIDDFIMHPVFGVGYDDGALGISLMFGLEPVAGTYGHLTTGDGRGLDLFLAFGAGYSLGELSFGFDLSGKFHGKPAHGPNKKGYEAPLPLFNLGVSINFDAEAFFAGVEFKTFDMAQKGVFAFGVDLVAGLNMGRDGMNLDGGKDGFFVGLDAHLYGLSNDGQGAKGKDTYSAMDIGFGLETGYYGLALTEKMTVGVGLDIGFEIHTFSMPKFDTIIGLTFGVHPELNWAVWEKGSIVFAYDFGITSDFKVKYPISQNDVTVKFKWAL